jgi:Flp pilus assembly protein TadB
LDALNTMRAILVAFAAVAAVLLGVRGEWTPALVLTLGIGAHGLLWVYLRRQRRRDAEQAIAGFEQLLAENG